MTFKYLQFLFLLLEIKTIFSTKQFFSRYCVIVDRRQNRENFQWDQPDQDSRLVSEQFLNLRSSLINSIKKDTRKSANSDAPDVNSPMTDEHATLPLAFDNVIAFHHAAAAAAYTIVWRATGFSICSENSSACENFFSLSLFLFTPLGRRRWESTYNVRTHTLG